MQSELLIVTATMLLTAAFPAAYFVIDYGIIRPIRGSVRWWKSLTGITLMLVGVSLLISSVAGATINLLDADHIDDALRVAAYVALTLTSHSLGLLYILERRGVKERKLLAAEEEPVSVPSTR